AEGGKTASIKSPIHGRFQLFPRGNARQTASLRKFSQHLGAVEPAIKLEPQIAEDANHCEAR
ncbi:MAG: hypothetical protein ACOVN2_10095, partial [Usitatibacteraceae bacterium]